MSDPSDVSDLQLIDGVEVETAKSIVIGLRDDLDGLKIDFRGEENYEELHTWETRLHQNMINLFPDPNHVTEISEIMRIAQEARAKARRAGTALSLSSLPANLAIKEIKKQLKRLNQRLEDPRLRSPICTRTGPSSENSDALQLFKQLSTLLKDSPLHKEIRDDEYKAIPDIAEYYLDQALKAYDGVAYGACMAMLGAMLETVMMGTLLRQDLRDDVLNCIDRNNKRFDLNRGDKQLCKKIVNNLRYEQYKIAIQDIFSLPSVMITADLIQAIRNSIHANRLLVNPKHTNIDEQWVINHLASLNHLIKILNDTL